MMGQYSYAAESHIQNGISKSVENPAKYLIVVFFFVQQEMFGGIYWIYFVFIVLFTPFYTLPSRQVEVRVAIRQDLFEVLSCPSQITKSKNGKLLVQKIQNFYFFFFWAIAFEIFFKERLIWPLVKKRHNDQISQIENIFRIFAHCAHFSKRYNYFPPKDL